jgi:hypothetical protein
MCPVRDVTYVSGRSAFIQRRHFAARFAESVAVTFSNIPPLLSVVTVVLRMS